MIAFLFVAAISSSPMEKSVSNITAVLERQKAYTQQYTSPTYLRRHYCDLYRSASSAKFKLKEAEAKRQIFAFEAGKDHDYTHQITPDEMETLQVTILRLEGEEAEYRSYCENGL